MRSHMFQACLAAAALSLVAGACTTTDDDADEVAAALELDNGGLDLDDEAPMFGLDADFAAAELESTTTYTDAMAEDPDVLAMERLDGAVRARVLIVWGQLPPDRDQEEARDWSGRLSVNRGALVVRRTIGFEEATDRVMPRTDRAAVDFVSRTRPFADGLALTVIDPEPGSADPLVLTYTPVAGDSRSIAIADLFAGRVVVEVDDTGNRLEAMALRQRDGDPCDHGFGRGRWRALRPHLGGMVGAIANADGEVIGHIRGLWGARRNGEQVFYGKYVDLAGQFRGIYGGHYRDGELAGRWLTRAGEHGRLHGGYRESLPGRPAGGHFILRWAETSCAQDLPAATE